MNTSPQSSKSTPKKKTGKSRRAAARKQKAAAAAAQLTKSHSLLPEEDEEPIDLKKHRTERDDLVRAVGEAVNSPVAKNGGKIDRPEDDNPNHISPNGNGNSDHHYEEEIGVDDGVDQPSPSVMAPSLPALVEEVTSVASSLMPAPAEKEIPSPPVVAPPLPALLDEAASTLSQAAEALIPENTNPASEDEEALMAPSLTALVSEAEAGIVSAATAEHLGETAAEVATEEICEAAAQTADSLLAPHDTAHAETEASTIADAPTTAAAEQSWEHHHNISVQQPIIDEHALYLHKIKNNEKPHTSSVHGLVINCAWPWCSTSPAAERQLLALTAAIKNIDNTAYPTIYCYPPSAMHVTLATLSSFIDANSAFARMSSNAKTQTMQQWKEALRSELRRTGVRPFSMLVSRLQVTETAIIFRIEDATSTIPAIRSTIRDISKSNPGGVPASDLHVPNIIHSTVARFMRTPSEELRSKLQQMCDELWTPVTVEVTSVAVVYEDAPYMHMTSCGDCCSQLQMEQQGKLLAIPLSIVAPNRQPSPALMPTPPPTPTATGAAPSAEAFPGASSMSRSASSSPSTAVSKTSTSSSWVIPASLFAAAAVGIGLMVMMRLKPFRK